MCIRDRERIYKLGDKDNFWSMGDTGPCGPCSEIMYDIGEEGSNCPNSETCTVECECGRFLEIWNLVFMQFDRSEDGQLVPLPSPSIDTGMGLERLASVMQDVKSNYDTDLFQYLTNYIATFLGTKYGKNKETDISIRVLSDHARAVTFLISDGVIPSSEGRGYVARRILRRAVRHNKKLGISDPFLHNLVGLVVEEMKGFYPELASQKDNIISIVINEEKKFLLTIDRGFDQLKEAMRMSSKKKIKSSTKVKTSDIVSFFNLDFKETIVQKKIKFEPSKEIIKSNEDQIIDNNENFIVLNKSSGISVQGGTKSKKNLVDIFAKSEIFQGTKPYSVHRLDKDTSGVFIMAKTRESAQLLTSLFRLRKVHKTYLAICHGELNKDSGEWNDDLIRYDGEKKIIEKAKTIYKVLDKNSEASLVELKPITGRKHQLRKQLYALGPVSYTHLTLPTNREV